MPWVSDSPAADPMYWRALAHLEEQWPDLLVDLLKSGRLEKHLDDVTNRAQVAAAKLQEANPNLRPDQIEEALAESHFAPTNPNYDPEKKHEFSPGIRTQLTSFKKRVAEAVTGWVEPD